METTSTMVLVPESDPLQPPEHASDPMDQLALLGGSGGDMMSRFEALSRLFRSEVEGLVGQEQAASRETAEQLRARITELEEQLSHQVFQAQTIAKRLQSFVEEKQPTCLTRIFGPNPSAEPEVASVEALGVFVQAFIQVNEEEQHPELVAAQGRVSELEASLAIRDAELAKLQADLREARTLKSEQEREIAEFQALRDKESELQECEIKLCHLQAEHQELLASHKVLTGRSSQNESTLAEKSRKLMTLMQQLEEQTQQCRLLSNENNTLRLQLGKDSEYVKVVQPPQDPLSYCSKAGALGEELQQEEQRMQEDLASLQQRYPGLPATGENCRGWCGTQIARQCGLYRSFLHLLQDFRQDAPAGIDTEFVSRAQEVDAAWIKGEEELRGADAAFQERERVHTKKWEEKRLQLTVERDAKTKELLERANKAQTKAESQLLLQQARLFGQRLDAQIERVWEEQKKERDARWAEHNQAKQESRQKFKDESLAVQQQADGVASASDRFQDMARARLAGVEDTWARKVEKSLSVSTTALRDGDLGECLRAAGLEHTRLPLEGGMYTGLSSISDTVEELIGLRTRERRNLCKEVEEQSLQQLRACVEKFVQKEGVQQRKAASAAGCEEEERAPEYTQAATIQGLLRGRQHRVVADTIRRQFQDFLLACRIANLAAVRLLPSHAAEALRSRGHVDLPPLPEELTTEAAAAGTKLPDEVKVTETGDTRHTVPGAGEDEATAGGDEYLEGKLLYEALLKRLLERLLNILHSQHREELLGLKRANAREIRVALQHLCQLEAAVVDKAAALDLEEYRGQIRTKLLSDCECHLCEERRQLSEQVDEDVEMQVRRYQREAAEEEVAALRERRRWLTERLVVMQSQGVINPGDRAVMQHLRNELRACEAKFELRERELAPGEVAKATASREQHPQERPPSRKESLVPTTVSNEGARPDDVPAPVVHRAPAPPVSARPTTRGSSPRPRPQEGTSTGTSPVQATSPVQTTSPAQWPAPQASSPLDPEVEVAAPALVQQTPSFQDSPATGASPTATDRRPAVPPSQPAPATARPRSSRQGSGRSPRHTRSHSPSFGASTAATGTSPTLGIRSSTQDLIAETVGAGPPLYEWPFEAAMLCTAKDTGPLKTARSLSAPKLQESKLPEGSCAFPQALPPLPRGGRGVLEDSGMGGYSHTAGISLGAPPVVMSGRLRSPRPAPHLLPPVPGSRGSA